MKPRIDVKKFVGGRDSFALWLATGFGSGFSPVAPGTFGSLVGAGLAWILMDYTLELRALMWSAIFFIGTWAAGRMSKILSVADHGGIVIDEIIGMGILSFLVGKSPLQFVLIFVLFRFFDIAKLPPVRQFDTWSKTQIDRSTFRVGFGVVFDDVLAALQAGLVILGINYTWGL